MQIQELMHQYYIDEKSGAAYAFIAGLIFLPLGALLWFKFSSNPLSRGISTGFIVMSVLFFTLAASTLFYNNKKIKSIDNLKTTSGIVLRQREAVRMEKVMNVTFRYAFISMGVLMLLALAVILISKNYYWKGIGISLMLLVALAIISDSFSMQRNAAYQQKIIGLKF